MLFTWLLLLVPLSLVLAYVVHAPPVWVFVTAAAAVVPLAEWMRRATEQLACRAGHTIGGLLNVTFGNVPELVLGLFVLQADHQRVVKAQITGAIIGNSLLGLGLAIVVGAWGKEKLQFNRERAGLVSSMFILAVIALLLPALFDHTERGLTGARDVRVLDERLSLGVSIVLILVYAANLLYTLVTHRDVFATPDSGQAAAWSLRKSLTVLAAATIAIAVEAELISGMLEETARGLGLSDFFLGIIVLAVIGNAAEYLSAVYFARQNRMSLVMGITVGSTIQVALLTAPLLVLLSHLIGHPMNLVFYSPLELIAIAGVAFIVNSIAQDGETNWFEGMLLLAVYALFGMAFFFVTG